MATRGATDTRDRRRADFTTWFPVCAVSVPNTLSPALPAKPRSLGWPSSIAAVRSAVRAGQPMDRATAPMTRRLLKMNEVAMRQHSADQRWPMTGEAWRTLVEGTRACSS
jgi:hypothetical protein